jgi:uncharacterized protein
MVWALVGCGSKLPTATLDVAGTPVKVEIASTHAARQQGLMHRDALGADQGMLFVYPKEEIRRFWMKDTRIPLSIAFLNRRGEIVRIEDMEPFDTRSVSSLVPATYALEMNKGWFSAHEIEKGAKVGGIPADIVPE